MCEQTYYRWRNQYGGLKADDAKRLKELEKHNVTLMRLLAEAELAKAVLKELAEGNFSARTGAAPPLITSSAGAGERTDDVPCKRVGSSTVDAPNVVWAVDFQFDADAHG